MAAAVAGLVAPEAFADSEAGQLLELLDREHQVAERIALALQFMDPDLSFGDRDAGWLAVALKLDADVAELLPLAVFGFQFDLEDGEGGEDVRQPALINRRLIELEVVLVIGVEPDAYRVRVPSTPRRNRSSVRYFSQNSASCSLVRAIAFSRQA